MAAGRLKTASGVATPDAFTKLHWESTGSGPPLLLIMGLGLSGGAWWRSIPTLAKRFQVLTYDNRGTGGSTALTYTYTTEAMADDALAVLDSAGIERAHVYGMSLGGMVAQQLALRHPKRVRRLVLGATQPGGRRAAVAEPEVMAFFQRRSELPSDESAWASVPYNYSSKARGRHAARIAEDIARRLAKPFDEHAYRAQMCSAALHNCFGRLRRLEQPTLVVHGTADRVIPFENAALMAARIPGAQLRPLRGCGHLYPTEEPRVDDAIGDFLEAADA
jgi:pimeloyl-ACP methyl ester carboxylesterase